MRYLWSFLSRRWKKFTLYLLFLFLSHSSNDGVLSHRIISSRLLQLAGLVDDLVVKIDFKSNFLNWRLCRFCNDFGRSDVRLLQCLFLVNDSLLRVVFALNQVLYFLIVESKFTADRSARFFLRARFWGRTLFFIPAGRRFS